MILLLTALYSYFTDCYRLNSATVNKGHHGIVGDVADGTDAIVSCVRTSPETVEMERQIRCREMQSLLCYFDILLTSPTS